MRKLDQKRIIWFLMIAFFAVIGNMYSQSSTYGNTFIVNNTEMAVVNIQHSFMNGGSGINKGIVGTNRNDVPGFMSFVGTAGHTGASDVAYVDGYVKTYKTATFVFPIGDNGKYRPAVITAASLANPANAAYYGISGSTAITSKFSGGNEPVLPAGGPFDTTQKGAGVAWVDNVEYWDINGATPTKIYLTWDANSAITSMGSLTILGWDGSKWVVIPSAANGTSILGGLSSLTTGSISTLSTLVPNTYSVYTLGSVCNSGSSAPILSSTALANSCPSTTANLNSLVTSSVPSGASLVWFTNDTHTGTAYATPLTAGAGTYYPFYYDSVNNCYGPAGSAVLVTITVSVGGTLSANQNICTGISASDIILTGNVGNVIKWQKSTDITFATPTDIANTATTLSASTIGTVNTTTYYRAVVESGSCSSALSTISGIIVAPSSVGGTISGSVRICLGSNATLILGGKVGNVIKWQSSSVMDFSSNVTDIVNTTQTLSTPSLTTTTYYRAMVQNGVCTPAYSSIGTITVDPVTVGGTITGSKNYCTGITNSTVLTLTGKTGSVMKWQSSSVTDFSSNVTDIASNSVSIVVSNVTATTYYRAVVQSGACVTAYSSAGIITIDALSVGGSIAGSTSVCPNTNSTSLTLSGIVGNVVKWQSSTSSIFSGTVTDIANTTTTLVATNLSVKTHYRAIVENGSCSSAMSGTATISIIPLLGSIGEISGPTSVCGLSSATYTVAPVANATNYIWTFPSGLSVYTSAGNSVLVNVDQLFIEGVITVKAINACQVSLLKTITVSKKPKITFINGPIATCGITTGTYEANTLDVATYNWTVPAGINITSGQGTPTIQVSYDSNYVTGNISLTATNSCGLTDVLNYRVNNIQMPTIINGLAQIGPATSGTYTTPAVSGMGYIWSVPTGVTIVSGQSTNSINLSFASTFSSGTISVAMISSCGISTQRTLDINRSQPILTIYGPESLCGIAQIIYDTTGQLVNYSTLYATYSVPVVSDALQYTWTVPQGATIVSGQGTNSIVMGFDITTFINGNITVTTSTQLGVGTTRSLAVNRVGGKIAGVTNVCNLTTTTYSVPATIGTNFTWTIPSWMSIVSGQGTNSITVSVGTPFANDTITLNFLSNCNTNESFALNVGCNTSTNIKDSQCGATLVAIDSSIYPNPIAGAQAYRYQVTNGANVRVFEPTTPLFNLTQLPGGVTFNTTYSIKVAVKLNNVWGGFGAPCTITTPLPITKVKANNCGITLATISTSIFADALIGVQGYRFEVTDPANSVRTVDTTTNLFNLTQLIGGVAYNTTYAIRVAANANGVWGAYGTSCSVTTPGIPTTKVINSQCGTTLSALNSSIYLVAVYGAQAYRFEVTNGTTVLTYDLTNTANLFNLTQLVGGAAYATTYSIRIASKVNGIWSAYGTSCTITTPSAITKVRAQFCGATLAALNTSIYADALIGVQGYRFEVTNGTNVRTFDATSNLFNLTQLIGGATIATTYSIRVAVKVNGVWGAYGISCNVTTPRPATKQNTNVVINEFSVKAYPNPFADIFKLELTSTNEDVVEIMVYDMLGKMITSQTVNPANINTIELGFEYTSGVYNVIIRQGNDTKTIRMIKR